MKIKRARLDVIIEQALLRGQVDAYQQLGAAHAEHQITSIRAAMRFCDGVDFGTFFCKYGCPITQANCKGAYGFWFTKHFDRLMGFELQPPSSLESGWAVGVIE